MSLIPVESRFREGQWAGRRAFIIGGGPSLRGFDFSLLKDELVVACNRSHECGVADVIVSGDRRWLARYRKQEQPKRSIPVVYARRFAHPWEPDDDVFLIGCCGSGHWGSSFAEGVSPGDSGIRAANFAALLGADPIYLMGIDLNARAGFHQTWWHGGYDRTNAGWYDSYLDHWNEVIESGDITQRLVNLSPVSRLTALESADWGGVLG